VPLEKDGTLRQLVVILDDVVHKRMLFQTNVWQSRYERTVPILRADGLHGSRRPLVVEVHDRGEYSEP